MFFNNYNKPGKGISKNEPPKKGFALYLDIIMRDFWSFVGINMLYCIFCMPIITIGGATLAFIQVSEKLLYKEHVFPLNDFMHYFKEYFKKGILLSFFIILIIADMFILAITVLTSGLNNTAHIIVLATVCFFIAILIISVFVYIFPIIIKGEKSPAVIVKKAILYAVLGKEKTMFCTVIILTAFAITIMYFPYTTVFWFTAGFYMLFTAISLLTSSAIKKYKL